MGQRTRNNLIVILLFAMIYCNQAKEVSIDSSKSILGASLDIALSTWISSQGSGSGSTEVEFVAVGLYCSSWYSYDGINWTVQVGSSVFPGCTGGSIYDVTYGNGTWIAVGTLIDNFSGRTNNSGLWRSTDGITWTRIITPIDSEFSTSLPLRSVRYGQLGGTNQFIAAGTKFGTSGSTSDRIYVIRSTDGINWTTFESLPQFEYGSLYGTCYVTFYEDKFYCPAEFGSYRAALDYDASSPPTIVDSFPKGGGSLENLVYNPPTTLVYDLFTYQLFPARSGGFYVFGNLLSGGNAVVSKRSNTGTWPASTNIGLGANSRPSGLAEGSDRIYAFGDSCDWTYSSNQGASWTVVTTLGSCGVTEPSIQWMSATFSQNLNRLVVVGDDGSIGSAGPSPTTSADWTYIHQLNGVVSVITGVASRSN